MCVSAPTHSCRVHSVVKSMKHSASLQPHCSRSVELGESTEVCLGDPALEGDTLLPKSCCLTLIHEDCDSSAQGFVHPQYFFVPHHSI